jgi:hypothetical protein
VDKSKGDKPNSRDPCQKKKFNTNPKIKATGCLLLRLDANNPMAIKHRFNRRSATYPPIIREES